ncbi:hypothetical protein BC938DRAFT_474589 [Jimgerdemannia flammicorona]|uniref:Uncharacterized protein n=1 Tax=Jimgerdemannia flammicorona TaxID=994334 RepID=A0A433Q248_9FUNG|nr:hypothetical protein BC938DRAFT_474589 [Jimgerdemannia flammicorona]
MDSSWRQPSALVASQQDNPSSDYGVQVILSEIPAGVTSTQILEALLCYKLAHVTVSAIRDNTTIVNGLSNDAYAALPSLGRLMVADQWPSDPSQGPENLPNPRPRDGSYIGRFRIVIGSAT